MSQGHQDTMSEALTRVALVIVAWLGSIKLGDVQTVVAILSGLAVLGYTCLQAWVLWRDKISARKRIR